MKRTFILLGLALICVRLSAQQFKVLLITETEGWHHKSIPNGISAIHELAATHNFDVVLQQNEREISSKSLGEFQAVIFLNTTGDIFNDKEQAAFEKFIQSGKGYVGIHAASDTEYDWEWYTQLVGRMFHIHPKQQTAKLDILDHGFPGLEHFPDRLLFTDEWYEFGEEKTSNLNYLITIDEQTFDPVVTWKGRDTDANGKLVDHVGKGMGDFHPLSWYHEFDGGRSFYTALGHIEKVYENEWFLAHLYGGIYYAATGKGIDDEK